jgi:inosine triphosphate pyrophosphatase
VTAILGTQHLARFQLKSVALDLPELQGKPEEVAREKARSAARLVEGPVLVEDTSLCFRALNGLPGCYIKDFLGAVGHDGLNRMLQASLGCEGSAPPGD